MEDILKSVFGPMFEAMLKGEMTNHLGYETNDHSNRKITNNRINGYINKSVKTKLGKVEIKVPRDREASFEPQLIEKRKSNVSGIEDKVINMYARGMSQRDSSKTIEEIYGFSIRRTTEMARETSRNPLLVCFSRLYLCFYKTGNVAKK